MSGAQEFPGAFPRDETLAAYNRGYQDAVDWAARQAAKAEEDTPLEEEEEEPLTDEEREWDKGWSKGYDQGHEVATKRAKEEADKEVARDETTATSMALNVHKFLRMHNRG